MVATQQQQRALAEKIEKSRQMLQRAHWNREEELRRAKHKQQWASKKKEKEGELKQKEDQTKQAQTLLKSLVERAERAANEDGTKGRKEKRPKPKPKPVHYYIVEENIAGGDNAPRTSPQERIDVDEENSGVPSPLAPETNPENNQPSPDGSGGSLPPSESETSEPNSSSR